MFSLWYHKFSSQPHQPFYAGGMVLFILFTAILLGAYAGVAAPDAAISTYHAYPMLFIVFIQFFLGFLFVVFPRFLMQAVIKPPLYMQVFFLYTAGSLLYLLLLFAAPVMLPLASLILLGGQVTAFVILLRIYRKSIMEDKYDTRWVLVAFAAGIAAHLLCMLSSFDLPYAAAMERLGVTAGFYLFLFLLVFAIAQRMVPLFTQTKVPGYVISKSPRLMETLCLLLTAKVTLLMWDVPAYNLLADIPLLLFFLREARRWKLPATQVPAIIWVLYLALAWIPAGFAISAAESVAYIVTGSSFVIEKGVVHAFAVGYVFTMLIGFGTRVVLGHSGRTPTADRTAVALFLFIQLVVLARLIAALAANFGTGYLFWIIAAAAMMLSVQIAWSARYLRYLVVPRYIP